jgi:hypothetical protein
MVDPHIASAMKMILNVVGKYLVKCKLKGVSAVTDSNVKEVLK